MATFVTSWLLCVIACHALYGFLEVESDCNEHQSSLLLQLRNTLVFNSSLSTKLVEWNARTDCCLWPGVECGESEQYVTTLDLSSECLEGGLNSSSSPLFDLRHLISLSLTDNSFNTLIPSGFGKLTELIHLNLSHAGFFGQVPVELSNLMRLVSLDLSSYSVEILNLHELVENLSKLQELRLDNTDLSTQSDVWGQVLASSLPNLQQLSLSSCGLSGPIHAALGNLTYLSVIDLCNNNFSVPFPQFFNNFKNLTSLSVTLCGFSSTFPLEILQVQSLRFLDISVNYNLHGSLPVLSQNSALETLTISETMFSGAIPKSIGDLKMLSHLDLSNSRFSGPLPDSMAKLTCLVHIDLSENSFSGPIPSFTQLKNLSVLYLGGNKLTGSVLSTNWNELSQLKLIMLSKNFLTGSIPTSLFGILSLNVVSLDHNEFTGFTEEFVNTSSSQLTALDLYNNNIEGSIPAFIYELKRLRDLDLSFNNFSNTLHVHALHQLKELAFLDLSYNKLAVEYGENDFLAFPNLHHLGLAFCKLNSFPSPIKTLIYVDLSNNKINGEIPSWIWNLDNDFSDILHILYLNFSHNSLQKLNIPGNSSRSYLSLDLSHNLFSGEIPSFLPSAEYLDLTNNMFTGVIPLMVRYSTNLFFLSISSNNLIGPIPSWICNSTKLIILDLSYNFLSGSIPPCLMSMSKLGVVNLMKNNIRGIISDSFASNCTMDTFNVNGNILQGTIPKSLSQCSSLQVLDMGNNKLQDKFPCWMRRSLPNLRILILRSNFLYGGVPCPQTRDFVGWMKLQILDLASNKFSGDLPAQQLLDWKAMQVNNESQPRAGRLHYQNDRFLYVNTVSITEKHQELKLTKILTIFSAVDFSDNNFQGKIPHELGHLTAILVLNISGNKLTGGIPASLGNLTNLESLDLSSNELSGRIPAELGDLTFLAVLNLSFNQLEGPIPNGGQMQTFPEDTGETKACVVHH